MTISNPERRFGYNMDKDVSLEEGIAWGADKIRVKKEFERKLSVVSGVVA